MKLWRIQVLRAVAALMVVFHHVADALYATNLQVSNLLWTQFGHIGAAGVDVFFVISGFIMVHICPSGFSSFGSAGKFILRRCVRIFPAYWVVTVFALLVWSLGIGYKSLAVSWDYVVGSFLCIPMVRHPVVDQGWTLSFEMYFYVLFALGMSCLVGVGRFLAISLIWFLAWIVGAWVTEIPIVDSFYGNPLLIEFWFGCLIGYLCHIKLLRSSGVIGNACLAVGLLLLCAGAHTGANWAWRSLIWGGPAILLLLWAVLTPGLGSRLWKPLILIGEASYSIYLVHGLILLATPRLVRSLPWSAAHGNALGVFLMMTCVVSGLAYWRWFELPVQGVAKRILPRD